MKDSSKTVRVDIRPEGISVDAQVGQRFLDLLRERGLPVDSTCGGEGRCGACCIRFSKAPPAPDDADRALLAPERLTEGWRLACRHAVEHETIIERRVAAGLDQKAEDVRRSGRPQGDGSPHPLGVAVDIGTTTLAVYGYDLEARASLGAAAARNPQRGYGADVISRIAHVRRSPEDGLRELQHAVVRGINALVDDLVEGTDMTREGIRRAVVVGNPTMLHLLLGVDPRGIDVAPFRPKFSDGVRTTAAAIGLALAPETAVATLPAVSAYVGADIVAGILDQGLHEARGAALFRDVGTNGEIVLAQEGRLTACSTAAGPAFEGASITDGMTASAGAIEDVEIQGAGVRVTTIGDAPPIGLCGTGLLAAVAELRAAGGINGQGRLIDPGGGLASRIHGGSKDANFRLTDGTPPVRLSQADIREFQLAKAAMRTGIEVLLSHCRVRATDLTHVLVGGAFSRRAHPAHLIETGLLPKVDPRRVEAVGNAAGRGASAVLLEPGLLDRAAEIARGVEYLELSGDERFRSRFVDNIPFPASA
ncbi:MAG: DUF4445 domain-containing protein [Candidatus Bipolaricaulota bacterium]|nr:MAG: DUF4445 domain-containing protein [Candidatus Bipolaricaulota bacterium]